MEGPYRHLMVMAMMYMRKVVSFPDESRLAALALLARFIEAKPQDLAGPKGRSCVVAGVMSMALKYVVHDVSIGALVTECGLAAEANVRVSDVVDAEMRILGVCTIGVRVPVIWTLSTALLDVIVVSIPPTGGLPGDTATAHHAAPGNSSCFSLTSVVAALSSQRFTCRDPNSGRRQGGPAGGGEAAVQRASTLALCTMITAALERVIISKHAAKLLCDPLFPLALPVACGLLTADDAAALLSVQSSTVQSSAKAINDAIMLMPTATDSLVSLR